MAKRRDIFIAVAMLALFADPNAAGAEFRFSSQTSLLAPDPFVKPKQAAKPKPKIVAQPKPPKPAEAQPGPRGPSVAEVRLAAFPGSMTVDAVARLTLDARTLKLIRQIEIHFAQSAEIVSGCRAHEHNVEVGGAPHSYHLSCRAADIAIKGVAANEIAAFALTLPERGGIGTYCGLDIVHVDVGSKRQWHRPCGLQVWHAPEEDSLVR
jgi:hypothetical protein